MRRMYGGMSKTNKYIIIGVLVVILLAIIGGLVWYLMKDDKKIVPAPAP